MKKAGKFILWTLGIIAWLIILLFFLITDSTTGNHTHQIIIIITGILLAIYFWKNKDSKTKELEKENQELKAEVQNLRQQLQDQAVRRAMDKAEKREKED